MASDDILPMEVQFTAVFDKVVFVLKVYTTISMAFKQRYDGNISKSTYSASNELRTALTAFVRILQDSQEGPPSEYTFHQGIL